MTGCFTPEKANDAFLASRPLIAQQILDLSVKHPNWMGELFQMTEWPNGEGTVMQQVVFKGSRPQIERGFDKWKREENLSGCAPTEVPNCSYNWTQFSGNGFERKLISLMSRDFRTPEYCVKEISSTSNFEEVFAKIIENIYMQVDFFKEFNIGQNYLTMLAKKFVVDAVGARYNPENIYTYRNIGSAKLSTLNISMAEFFYEQMRRIPGVIPYDVVDGSPVYAMMASHQLFSRLYRDDPNVRQDVRFSGYANDLLTKYNFMSTIRGMFIMAPILYPRRFNIVSGEPVEVLPFINGVPMEVGVYTDMNPMYEAATHEEVLIHGRSPFKTFYKQTPTTLGSGTDFGPEPTFMNQWKWVNPETSTDPFRRAGYFATTAEIGLSAQFSEGIFGILVERPNVTLMAMYTPNPVGPVTPPTISNSVPDSVCPCPLVLGLTPNPYTALNYDFVFAVPVAGVAEDPITLVFDNGLSIVGTLKQISADGLTARIQFTAALPNGANTQIIGVNCGVATHCSAKVDFASDCRSGQKDYVELILARAIKANTANQVITAYFGDCSELNLKIVSVDPSTLTYRVSYATGQGPRDNPTGAGGPPATNAPLSADMICDRGGIIKVCVPTATDSTCPACDLTAATCSGAQAG